MRLVDADALGIGRCKEGAFEIRWYALGWNSAIDIIENAPTVDAIPIDNVAEMLAGMYGDCCPCNYLDIDEGISVDCKRKNCPGFFETDYSCWKKYVKYWMVKKDATE